MAGITIARFSKNLTASLDSHRFDRSALQVSFRVLQRSALAMTCSVLICRGAGYLAVSFLLLSATNWLRLLRSYAFLVCKWLLPTEFE